MYNRDIPSQDVGYPFPENELDKVIQVALPILGGLQIMATDMLESMRHHVIIGNNTTIYLEPDTLAETQRLFDALSDGGSDIVPLSKQFWATYWGCCLDKFGIR